MSLRSGMWAVLFTDLVGSTEQRARLGDEFGDEVRRDHDTVLSRVLAKHRGELVSDTGDGAMCVFASAADAISAGVAIQQAIERLNQSRKKEALRLRVGVSVGELVVEGPGLMGLAAHEAARICALCEPGQVLVSDLVRLMAGSRTSAQLVERGSFDLKGIPAPVAVWEVRWEPADDEPVPLPSRLFARDAWAFSGRERELAALRDLWGAASAGSRRAVLIAGEPGIGKTRLAAETARLAREDGGLVLYGQCDDELSTPFQPFAEMLDWYFERVLTAVTGAFPGDLARLSGRVLDRVPNAPAPLVADPETEQRRLYDAVASWVSDLAGDQPVILVLDDLHWATKPTLLMMRHLLRNSDDARVLLIGTYRDTDLDRLHPLATMLADFRRTAGVERIPLAGLDEIGVLELLVQAAEQEPDERIRELAGALAAETEGNPFFVGEVLRHLAESGAIVRADGRWTSDRSVDELGIPEGVREVVGQRLDRLGDSANELLTTAAMVGREFTLGLLTEITMVGADEILAVLEEATRARIVEEIGVDRFRFSHALVRTTLRDEVGASRRLRLHRRVAEALERLEPDNDAALAHHWLEAAAGGDPPRAIDHAVRAASRAVDVGAFDDAIQLYDRALELADDSDLDEARRELLLGLGRAQSLAGAPETMATMVEAVDSAERANDVPRLVRGLALFGGFGFSVDERIAAMMMAALEFVGDDLPRERALLLTAAANQILYAPWERRVGFAEEALAIARVLDDPELLVRVGSFYIQVLSVPENLDQRLALTREMNALEPRLTNAIARWDALPVQPLWEAGLLEQVERSDAKAAAICEQVPFVHGRVVMVEHRAKRALFEGDLATAERLAQDAVGFNPSVREWYIIFAAQLAFIRCEQGRAREVLDAAREIAEDVVGTDLESLVRATEARLMFESGDTDAAAQLLRSEASHHFEAARRDGNWYPYQVQWAELAAEFRDLQAAEQLCEALLPFADRIANFIPVAFGAVSRLVGRLETVLERYDEAEGHLADAARRHEELGAMLYLARTWADQAELINRRDNDARAARDLLDRATALAQEHGAVGVERYVQRVIERASS